MNRFMVVALLLFFSRPAIPQSNGQANDPSSLDRFPWEDSVPLKIVRDVIPSRSFTVVGPRGAILGRQDGAFEAWIFPWKIFSNLRISAEIPLLDARRPKPDVPAQKPPCTFHARSAGRSSETIQVVSPN